MKMKIAVLISFVGFCAGAQATEDVSLEIPATPALSQRAIDDIISPEFKSARVELRISSWTPQQFKSLNGYENGWPGFQVALLSTSWQPTTALLFSAFGGVGYFHLSRTLESHLAVGDFESHQNLSMITPEAGLQIRFRFPRFSLLQPYARLAYAPVWALKHDIAADDGSGDFGQGYSYSAGFAFEPKFLEDKRIAFNFKTRWTHGELQQDDDLEGWGFEGGLQIIF